MKNIVSAILTLTLILGALIGCSGGGSTAYFAPTTAVLTLASSGTGTIYGIDTTITLPAGVTVKSTANPPETDSGVVSAAGSAAGGLVTGIYTAATGTSPATVRVMIAKADGFSTGDFATVTCDIAPGHVPQAQDFSITSFAASDQTGTALTGITAGLTAELR